MPLNSRQEAFAQLIADNNKPRYAAIEAGYSEKTADQISSRLLKNVKVAARVEELREATTTEKTLTRQQIREIRAEIALDTDNSKQDRLAALRDDSKMMGWDAPQKIEHSGGVSVIQATPEDERI